MFGYIRGDGESMRWFWLYRPQLPSARAQAIQVVHMAHAMACRGHEVTLWADPAGEERLGVDKILDYYGLAPHPGLRLGILPRSRTLASIAFRAAWVRWARGGGVVYARSKRYAMEVARFFPKLPIVLEAHEVDSLQAMERGEDPESWRVLEREVLSVARGVVANAGGTLRLLKEVHPELPPSRVSHNGCHGDRIRAPRDGEGIGYVGSIRASKGLTDLASAAARLEPSVTLVSPDDAQELVRMSDGKLRVEPELRHMEVPDRLAQFRVLVLPLAPGWFGEELTSPLKLWDYLAAGVPIVAANTPAMRDAAEGMFHPYEPGNVDDLVRALQEAYSDEHLRKRLLSRARVRTWAQRAAEVDDFVCEVLP